MDTNYLYSLNSAQYDHIAITSLPYSVYIIHLYNTNSNNMTKFLLTNCILSKQPIQHIHLPNSIMQCKGREIHSQQVLRIMVVNPLQRISFPFQYTFSF